MRGRPEAHPAILAYLKETFPPWEVMPPRDCAGGEAPVFPVVQNYVERQLEIERGILDERPDTLVHLLRNRRVAETMRDEPGRRVVVRRASDGRVLVAIEGLRKTGSGVAAPGKQDVQG